MAAAADVPRMEPSATPRISDVREGTPRPQPRPASVSARGMDLSAGGRLHGPDHDHLYAGSYGDADLHWWADRIREWHRQHFDVFAYFNNDGYGHAVTDARRLRTLTTS
jgi:uncharacterized protein YecE (DUF72 family)